MNSRKSLLADIALLVPVIVWAANFTVVHDAMASWSDAKYTFLALRFWVATLALGIFIIPRFNKGSFNWQAYLVPGAWVGLSLVIAYASQTAALVHATASKTAFITSMNVVFVPLFSGIVLHQKIGKHAVIGVILAFVGLSFLCLQENFQIKVPDVLSLICAVALAADVLIIGRFAATLDPLPLTAMSTLSIALAMTLISLITEVPHGVPALNRHVFFAIIFTGLIATALCFWIQAKAQRFTSPTHAALIFSLEPAIAAFLGYLWSHERFTTRMGWGAFLILLGTITAEVGANLFRPVPVGNPQETLPG